ncbi:MAG: hypothetical protein MR008_02985 [Aerococcus sp.]|nr:hypothetical protein [Aerococcus sp.]
MESLALYDHLKAIQHAALPHFYVERINFGIKELTEWHTVKRTIAAPQLLNELGVRRNEDIQKLRQLLIEKGTIEPLGSDVIAQDLANLPIKHLGFYLDVYVLTIGDYAVAYDAVKAKLAKDGRVDNYENCLYIAAYLAAMVDDDAVTYLQRAKELANDQYERILCQHRLATYYIKRTKDDEKQSEALSDLFYMINQIEEEAVRWAYIAIFDNLYSLFLTKHHTPYKQIMVLLQNALSVIKASLNSPIFTEQMKIQIARYRSQLSINLSQLYADKEHTPKAIAILLDDLKTVQRYAPDYLGECYGALAYTYYLNKDYEAAIDYGTKAYQFFEAIGSVAGWNTSKDILVAAHYKHGDMELAQQYFETTLDDLVAAENE